MKTNLLLIVLLSTLVGAGHVAAQEKFSGYMMGDYYYVAQHNKAEFEELNGFQFRRIYFTYDKVLDDGVSVRLRTEFANAGDFMTKAKMVPVAKDAYLKMKRGGRSWYFGISGTPTWGKLEKWWGYRNVEKTVADLQKFGSSRDFGVAVKGDLQDGVIEYHLMLANGNSNSSENDKQKAVMGAVTFHLDDSFFIEGYIDRFFKPGEKSYTSLQGFAGFKTGSTKAGVQYLAQIRDTGPGGDEETFSLFSLFLTGRLNETTGFYTRFDHTFEPNAKGDDIAYLPFAETAKSNLFIAGLDFTVAKDVHFMPNVEMITYSAADDAATADVPDNDVIPRLTLYYEF